MVDQLFQLFQEVRNSSGESQDIFGLWDNLALALSSYKEPESSLQHSEEKCGVWNDQEPSKESYKDQESSSEQSREMFGAVGDRPVLAKKGPWGPSGSWVFEMSI